jgi:ABC-2 type transport system permease protein
VHVAPNGHYAVTPDSLRYLLVDLVEANTFWRLATERVVSEQVDRGAWRVTLDVLARKVVVDSVGVESEVAMDDLIEIGVFGVRGESLYLQKHRVRSGKQRIIVTVTGTPSRAGIDPRNLLIDVLASSQ